MVLLEVEGVRIESEERRCSLTRPAGPNFLFMLRPSAKLEEIDRRHARVRLARRSYTEALAVFAALWREAAALDPDFPGPWRDDLEADLAVARAVNALPPDA